MQTHSDTYARRPVICTWYRWTCSDVCSLLRTVIAKNSDECQWWNYGNYFMRRYKDILDSVQCFDHRLTMKRPHSWVHRQRKEQKKKREKNLCFLTNDILGSISNEFISMVHVVDYWNASSIQKIEFFMFVSYHNFDN